MSCWNWTKASRYNGYKCDCSIINASCLPACLLAYLFTKLAWCIISMEPNYDWSQVGKLCLHSTLFYKYFVSQLECNRFSQCKYPPKKTDTQTQRYMSKSYNLSNFFFLYLYQKTIIILHLYILKFLLIFFLFLILVMFIIAREFGLYKKKIVKLWVEKPSWSASMIDEWRNRVYNWSRVPLVMIISWMQNNLQSDPPTMDSFVDTQHTYVIE